MSALIVPVAVFVGVAALVALAGSLLTKAAETEVEDRLDMLTGSSTAKQAKDTLLKGSVLARPLESSQHLSWTRLSRMGNLLLLFEQADASLTPQQFFGISGVLALVGMFIPVVAGLHPTHRAADGLCCWRCCRMCGCCCAARSRLRQVCRAACPTRWSWSRGPCAPGTAWPRASAWLPTK